MIWTVGAELLAAAAGAELLAAPLGACDTASPPFDFSVDPTRRANQFTTRSFAASDQNYVSLSSAKQFSNLWRQDSSCCNHFSAHRIS